ncbi:hypothetical protein MXD81_53135 [Microbacteriaceae bacterium K1510]|nr:hypothetical protein [Microbacteriaceae bacterium K1510]
MRQHIRAAVACVLMFFAGAAAAQTPKAVAPDIAFARQIAFIRAHIATGEELVQQRDWALAYRHFMFPVEEVYGAIRLDLRTYKTPPFDFALKTLANTAKARDAKRYQPALQKVQTSLAAADAGLKARQPDWPSFVLRAAVAILAAAPDEYEDAVVEGRITRPISYQVARSYVLEAQRMIDSVADALAAKNADALRDIRDNLAQLKMTFAPLAAPQQPPQELAAVTERVAKIEAAAAKL